jgi:hypothetical protein
MKGKQLFSFMITFLNMTNLMKNTQSANDIEVFTFSLLK